MHFLLIIHRIRVNLIICIKIKRKLKMGLRFHLESGLESNLILEIIHTNFQ